MIGEGNGNPLQYSCLENPIDRGTWKATVHGVAKSRTQVRQLNTCQGIGKTLQGKYKCPNVTVYSRVELTSECSLITLSYRKKKVEEEVTLQTSPPITENQSAELQLSRIVWTTSGSFPICGSCSYILKLITIRVSLTADSPVKLQVRVDIFTSCRPFSPT